jgi:hypothetical protein
MLSPKKKSLVKSIAMLSPTPLQARLHYSDLFLPCAGSWAGQGPHTPSFGEERDILIGDLQTDVLNGNSRAMRRSEHASQS